MGACGGILESSAAQVLGGGWLCIKIRSIVIVCDHETIQNLKNKPPQCHPWADNLQVPAQGFNLNFGTCQWSFSQLWWHPWIVCLLPHDLLGANRKRNSHLPDPSRGRHPLVYHQHVFLQIISFNYPDSGSWAQGAGVHFWQDLSVFSFSNVLLFLSNSSVSTSNGSSAGMETAAGREV